MSPPRILIIEDDPDLARLLTFDLEERGFTVRHAVSGMAGLMQAREETPDLIVLDLRLPDFDGSMVVTRMRANSRVPILVLTARDTVDEKVRLLNLGADDYLVKPFHREELIARVRALLRSRGEVALAIGDLTLHPVQRRASFRGLELPFTPTELNILLVLAQEPGRVYQRKELGEVIWQGELPEHSNAIDMHIANIRNKLRDVGAFRVLRSVRGIGYALYE